MQRIVVYDSQRLNAIQLCMRQYKHRFIDAVTALTKPSYLEEGDLVHKMLETYYNCKKHRVHWASNHRSHADVVDACVKVGRHHAIKMALDGEDVDLTIRSFQEYCTFYANDGWDDIKFIERVASKVLYQDDSLVILYEGKIDLVISLPNCPIFPIDHKSSKQKKQPEMLSNQFIGYCWLLGVSNIGVNKVGLQKTLKGPDKFQRYTLSYADDILNEWVESSVWWIKRQLHLEEEGYWPPNFTSCDKWGGCTYREICQSDRSTREYKLLQLFEKETKVWDVGGSNL